MVLVKFGSAINLPKLLKVKKRTIVRLLLVVRHRWLALNLSRDDLSVLMLLREAHLVRAVGWRMMNLARS